MYTAATLMVILVSIIGILASTIPTNPIVVAPQVLPTSCDPSTSLSNSTYELYAFPLNNTVVANASAIRTYMTDHSGCKTISGDGNGVITGLRCGSSDPGTIIDDIPRWSIDNSFNPEVCIPGSKCL